MENSGSQALAELKAKLPELRSALNTQHIIVFGSQASGNADENSDLDVILVSERFNEEKRPNRRRLLRGVVWDHRSVDVVCLTPVEFEKLRNWPGIVHDACEHGIWL